MFWTEETYRIHELTPGEVPTGSAEHIARSLACYDEPYRPRIMEAFRRCAEEGKGYDYEVAFTTAKGRRLWVRTIAEAVWDGGKIVRVVGNIVDITERKRSEEVLQARLRLSDAAGKIGLEELLRQALDETERITGSSSGFVHFLDEDPEGLVPANVVHEHAGEIVQRGGPGPPLRSGRSRRVGGLHPRAAAGRPQRLPGASTPQGDARWPRSGPPRARGPHP